MNYFKNKLQAKRRIFSMVTTCMLFLFFITTNIVYGQEKTIPVVKGVVKNDAGETLAGATVSINGTKISITTKSDGTFELKNVREGAVLSVSYVGHTRTEIKLKPGQADVSIKMTSSTGVLSEVVVNNGLYKRPAGNFTGASKTYTGEQLKSVNPSNVLQALATVDPAVRIEQNNTLGSDPNQLPIIQIRGQNNLPVSTQGGATASATPVSNGDIMSSYLLNPNQPLIILDGFQTTLQTIYDMDINRIASITVLKDAAATTAYGSKAANGVIVVETKQPVAGKTQITYSINVGVEVPDLTSYHLLDANGLLEAQRLAGVYTDPNNHFNDLALKQWYDYRLQQVQSGVNTYWLSQPVRTGYNTNHSLNISGGARSVRYALSLNYGNGVGVMKGSGRDRFGLNYNLTYVNKNLRFSNNTSVSYSKGNATPWGSYSQYASQFPFFKPTDSAGNTLKILEPNNTTLGIANPAPGSPFTNAAYNAGLEMKNYGYTLGFTNNTNIEWTINREMRMRAAISFLNNLPGSEQFFPADHTIFVNALVAGFSDFGSYSQSRGKNTVIDGKLSFDYNKRFGDHTIMTAIGVSGQSTTSNSTTIQVSGLPNDYLNQLGMANGYGLTNTKPNSISNLTRSLSSYASVSYNYAGRYTAEITANASGSSQFGANNRLAPFWAGGVSWNVDKEKFFKKNNIIQQLKVSLTTGVTGNQNFAAHMSQPIFQYNLQNNYRLQLGANLQGYANPDLKWQQTIKNNIGVSAGMFNGKLFVGLDYYTENTDNLILPLDVAPSTGFVNYQDNLGAVKNSGYELSLSSPIIQNRKKNIFWSLGFNVGHAENVITKLSPAIEALNKANNSTTDSKLQLTPLPRYEVGQSMSRIWAVQSLGIDPATGKEVFVKLDGSKTFTWDPNDKRPVGDAFSKLKGSISSNFNYKGFKFNIIFGYEYGGQMYNQTLVDKIENVNLLVTNADERVLTERWKQPGDIVSYKALVANGTNGLQLTNSTSRFVQDNNYLEAKSMTVGYTFPSNLEWVRKMHLSTPSLYITLANPFRFATIKTERGTGYPFARTFNFGLSTTF